MSATPAATKLSLVVTDGFPDYALIDSGEGRKLERLGRIVIDRPEPQAMWQRRAPDRWRDANAVFSASKDDEEKGKWRIDRPVPESWPVRVDGATMLCRLSSLWHFGLFPEQMPHWQFMVSRLKAVTTERPRVLNLFAYTGAASLIAAAAGAEVTHVDASKKSVSWARENQQASKLADAPVRWIVEDARRFVAREVRRGRTYHVILVDPPKFGRGPEGEVWELFEHLPALLADCAKLLAPKQSSLVLTAYAIRASALALDGLARECLSGRDGTFETGELAIREQSAGRLLPTSMFVRWSAADA